MSNNYESYLDGITRVDGYRTLHPCAQTAFHEAFSYTVSAANCQSADPPARYSHCLCTGHASSVGTLLSAGVKSYGCSAATEVSSVLGVFSEFCSSASQAYATQFPDGDGGGAIFGTGDACMM